MCVVHANTNKLNTPNRNDVPCPAPTACPAEVAVDAGDS